MSDYLLVRVAPMGILKKEGRVVLRRTRTSWLKLLSSPVLSQLERPTKQMREAEQRLKAIPQFCFPDAKDWSPVSEYTRYDQESSMCSVKFIITSWSFKGILSSKAVASNYCLKKNFFISNNFMALVLINMAYHHDYLSMPLHRHCWHGIESFILCITAATPLHKCKTGPHPTKICCPLSFFIICFYLCSCLHVYTCLFWLSCVYIYFLL